MLLPPQCFGLTAYGHVYIVEGNDLILIDIAAQDAVLRKADGKGCLFPRFSPVVDEPVCMEATHAVEARAGFQVTLGYRDHLTYRSCRWGDRWIMADRRSRDRGRDLDVR